MNEKNEINFEKIEKSEVDNGLKNDHSVQEKKLIQRKRKCDTPRVNLNKLLLKILELQNRSG